MRAVVIDAFNQSGSVRELRDPKIEPGSVLVRVTVAGINPIDWKVRAGKAGDRSFPLVLGQDFAGTVERVGDGVTRVGVGDRVFGCARSHGSYAEKTLIGENDHTSPFARLPGGIIDTTGAALPTPCMTALGSLDILGIGKESDVLIVGAAGAVGSAAVQIAHARGAQVTAVVRPGQSDGLPGFGAQNVVEADGDFMEPVRRAHAEPFDAVLDMVSSGDTLKAHLPLYARGGKLVTTIHVADESWFAERGIGASNVAAFETGAASPKGLETIAQMVLDGTLRVQSAAERPLEEAPAVLDDLQSGKLHGKIVLRVA
jgi:NADPH:quinone reductase-like Zn-dependent oxidoreductase